MLKLKIVQFQLISATKAYNPDYRPNNASDPPTEKCKFGPWFNLNTSDEGMISPVKPASYTNITVRATLSGIQFIHQESPKPANYQHGCLLS